MVSGFLPGLTACEDPLKIGSDLLPDGSQGGVFFSDTFTVRSSTVLLDSVRTSGGGLMLGRYTDPSLGVVEARSFFQVATLRNDTLKSDSRAVYDSLVLTLRYTGYSYGDTTRPQQVAVHRLRDTLTNDRAYLNSSSVPYESSPLGQKRYRPVFNRNQINDLNIRLSDALGRELFGLAGKPESTDPKAFRDYVKGFALLPGAGDEGSIVQFSQAFLTVFYHADTLRKEYTAYLSGIQTPTARFARVTHQRTGALAMLTQPGQSLPSARTNEEVYVQQAGGLAVKLEFPTLRNLRNLPQGRVAINQAELILEPRLPVPTNISLPFSLTLAENDATNLPLRTSQNQIRYVVSEGNPGALLASGLDANNEWFLFNLTTQLQQMLTGQRTASGLVLLREPPTSSQTNAPLINALFATDVSRAVFDARRIRLRLYYTISNN